ncbi:MAG: Unknown protein [uncultured Sulfurovum sp.]|uniref:Uncharacterized protein n=1 Tax=uncultured Sulfurovum sp. TaxID=269237 RepID=A0A6S6SRU9_9BACT|nr:MAG: Unknown protein [uncultured Sulfurovum sp.]
MTKKERFIEVLRRFETPVTVSEWAKRVVHEYPHILNQINSETNEPMTLKALATIISLKVSRGEFSELKVLDSEPYRHVMYMSENKKNDVIKLEVSKDIEGIMLESKMHEDIKKSTEQDKYRLEELKSICSQLNKYFSLNFMLHHTQSLSNFKNRGRHHVDNIEVLTIEHSLLKKEGRKKFSVEEQKAYIKRVISVHMMIDKSIDINLTDEVLEMLLDRLEKIY